MADRKFKQQLSKANVATIHIEMADRKFKQQLFKATDDTIQTEMTDWKFKQLLFMITDVTKHTETADRKFKQQLLSKATEHRGIVDSTSQCRSEAHELEFEPRHVGFVFTLIGSDPQLER